MSGMVKMLDFAPVNSYGEKVIRILGPDNNTNVKVASEEAFAPSIREFIESLKPVKDKIYALINAMGATEFFGCNKNGDSFYEGDLKRTHPTFVSKGKPFMHHLNKESDKAYGKVIASDYNDKMHRVELVVEYDTNELSPKYVKKLNDGDVVNVSMGCRVPYDICSICGHKAKTPAEYCECLTTSPGLGKLLPDGRRASAINTEPEFFDISIVTIPADPTARVLTKVASQSETKSSVERAREVFKIKQAEGPIKRIENDEIMEGMQSLLSKFDFAMGEDIPSSILDRLAGLNDNPMSILKSFINKKIFLRPNEVQRIILVSSGKKDMADQLDESKIVMLNDPEIGLKHLNAAPEDPDIFNVLPEETIEPRKLEPGNIKRVVIKMFLGPEKTAGLEQVPVSDSFKQLSGRQEIEAAPNFINDPLGALKTYLALGSLVAAFSSALGKSTSKGLMKNIGLSSLIAGPLLANSISETNELVNRPSQEMMLMNPDNPEAVQNALLNAIEDANMHSDIKVGSLRPDFGTRALLSLPIAYGASKLISSEAKKNAIEKSKYTGKYDPSFLSNTEYTLPLSLGLILKYASAEKTAKEYVKTASTLLPRYYTSPSTHLIERLENILFK